MHILHSEHHLQDGIVEFLLREATAINSNVEEKSVQEVVELGGLSWQMIEDQRKGVVMGRLRAIGHLDETQCNELYHKMELDISRYREIVIRYYNSWFMKCMNSVSDCFKC